jgi:hypothetical protein
VAGRFEPGVQGFTLDGFCEHRQGFELLCPWRCPPVCGLLSGFAAGSDLSGVDR